MGAACIYLTLSKYDVTIVARNMPGDPLAPGWASPFAGANLAPVHQFEEGVTEQHVRMQKQCFDEFFKLVDAFPESSARRTDAFEYQEKLKSCKDVWFNVLPKVSWALRMGTLAMECVLCRRVCVDRPWRWRSR